MSAIFKEKSNYLHIRMACRPNESGYVKYYCISLTDDGQSSMEYHFSMSCGTEMKNIKPYIRTFTHK
jgi:hypothetical protein